MFEETENQQFRVKVFIFLRPLDSVARDPRLADPLLATPLVADRKCQA